MAIKRYVFIFIVVLLLATSLSLVPNSEKADADMGPKQSVIITFLNLGDSPCYVTLLSEKEFCGPYRTYDTEYSSEPTAIDLAFINYADKDGFYYLMYNDRCDESKYFRWGYYPPSTFKILLYYPDTDTFISSAILQSYAFSSYFEVDVDDMTVNASGEKIINPVKNYDYASEVILFIIRMLLTVLIELEIGLLFGYRSKLQIITITVTNVFTQLILNLILSLLNYFYGFLMAIIFLIIAETIVFIIELIVYRFLLTKEDKSERYMAKVFLYTALANVTSILLGLLVGFIIP